ncbi:MAG: hypothetical protein L0216_12405 [Planctomycetales bacterium]|nr:hypothetical protein [Planctomycetales bacterium]
MPATLAPAALPRDAREAEAGARFDALRRRHPALVYESFETARDGSALRVRFRIRLLPDILFEPETVFPDVPWDRVLRLPPAALGRALFHLGLIECLSHWKAACPPRIEVRAGPLDADERAFFLDLLRRGLSEFFYVNRLDPRRPDLVEVAASAPDRAPRPAPAPDPGAPGLFGVGGGKDSALGLGILLESRRPVRPLLLNPVPAARAVCRALGSPEPLVVSRTIAPDLLRLNGEGYWNGHTPFSALLAALGTAAALLHGAPEFLVANERSAGEGSLRWRGLEVNHQYSKGGRFERAWRGFARRRIGDVRYASLLRPLGELQVVRALAGRPAAHGAFVSCNRGGREGRWCRTCPKCLFTATLLSAFLPGPEVAAILGGDPLADPAGAATLLALCGVGAPKPLDCVGTLAESRAAVALAADRRRSEGALPPALGGAALALGPRLEAARADAPRLLAGWGDDRGLTPAERDAVRRAAEVGA